MMPNVIIDRCKESPLEGLMEAGNFIRDVFSSASGGEWNERDHELLLEYYALLIAIEESGTISLPLNTGLLIKGDIGSDCGKILDLMNQVSAYAIERTSLIKFENIKSKMRVNIGKSFKYEFSSGDYERIQVLINSLRDLISASKSIQEDHKSRLLRRLEKLQGELHKSMSDLDRFWGLIGEAGIVIKKFGEDVKPVVDRIKELAQIVWATQTRAEELPSGSNPPLLEFPDANSGDSSSD